MNFSAYENNFQPSSQILQYTIEKYSNADGTPVNSANCQNAAVMTDDLGADHYQNHNHYQNEQSEMQTKCERDSATQVDGVGTSMTPPRDENAHQYSYGREGEEAIRRHYLDVSEHDQDIKDERKDEREYMTMDGQRAGMPPYWQSVAAPGSTVADYLSHIPASTLPVSLQHFMKYSSEVSNKRDVETSMDVPLDGRPPLVSLKKRRQKKKIVKEKKPRPGSIRLTTALDGSTLFCCPECQMAYPDKTMLEQHLMGHSLERRYFCDICGAGLKRKDHLTRHKLSHNAERPFVCTVCLKAFKRKEQLTLHFVIHSGEKRHVCTECGKGFYRKDHLRKHTRSHITRRMKAEAGQQGGAHPQPHAHPHPREKSEEEHY